MQFSSVSICNFPLYLHVAEHVSGVQQREFPISLTLLFVFSGPALSAIVLDITPRSPQIFPPSLKSLTARSK